MRVRRTFQEILAAGIARAEREDREAVDRALAETDRPLIAAARRARARRTRSATLRAQKSLRAALVEDTSIA